MIAVWHCGTIGTALNKRSRACRFNRPQLPPLPVPMETIITVEMLSTGGERDRA